MYCYEAELSFEPLFEAVRQLFEEISWKLSRRMFFDSEKVLSFFRRFYPSPHENIVNGVDYILYSWIHTFFYIVIELVHVPYLF